MCVVREIFLVFVGTFLNSVGSISEMKERMAEERASEDAANNQ